ncbi:uncharacterized protein [Watersipora subatra]|uniref:uncharacterized protein isoform X2 n=1 Tax=Watersipora subatra TaxID=2589382 RepID=UPI00355C1AD7
MEIVDFTDEVPQQSLPRPSKLPPIKKNKVTPVENGTVGTGSSLLETGTTAVTSKAGAAILKKPLLLIISISAVAVTTVVLAVGFGLNWGDMPSSSTQESTTTTEQITTTPQSNTSVSHTFLLSINERFKAELLDPADFPHQLLSRETSTNVSGLFSQNEAYRGCAVESLVEGSIKVTLSILFLYPPMTNLTEMEASVLTTMTSSLPNSVEDNVTLIDTCMDCADIADIEAIINIQIIDYCAAGNECADNGTCVNGLDRYFCLCDSGYYGTHCDRLKSECDSGMCSNNGECAATMTGDIICECVAPYGGNSCAVNVNPCANASITCSGHGDCYVLPENDFLCICEAGYNGTSCEENIDDCGSDPCFHGNCTDGVNSFTCSCDTGYEGEQCQTNIDDCISTPCGLNATCYDLLNDYACLCSPGFTGSDCHNVCNDSPCYNNGSCSLCLNGYCEDTKLAFMCDCPDGIYGLLCTDEKYPGLG